MISTARLLGASMRLTRLVIHDELGERLIQHPLDNLVVRYSHVEHHPRYMVGGQVFPAREEVTYPDWLWIRDGLTCPACIGFWITLGVLSLESLPVVGRSVAWRTLSSALALNEAALQIIEWASRGSVPAGGGDGENGAG